MKYINKKLTIEKLSVETIAKRYGTPTYCYSHKQFKQNILNFEEKHNIKIEKGELSRGILFVIFNSIFH